MQLALDKTTTKQPKKEKKMHKKTKKYLAVYNIYYSEIFFCSELYLRSFDVSKDFLSMCRK